MAEQKLDIFRVLNAINKRDRTFYENLTETEKKGFQPYIVQRWMSGCSDDYQNLILNENVNRYLYDFKDKSLLYDLFVASSNGKNIKYQWKKPNNDKSKPLSIKVLKDHFNWSSKEALENLPYISKEFLLNLSESLDKKQQEELKKELNG